MSRETREPTPQQAPAIAALVQHYGRRGELLPTAETEVRASLDQWLVSEENETPMVRLLQRPVHLPELSEVDIGGNDGER